MGWCPNRKGWSWARFGSSRLTTPGAILKRYRVNGCLLGTGALVPQGGLTARLLRRVRIDGVVSDGRRVLSELVRQGPVKSETHPAKGPRSRLPRVAPCRCWRNTQAAVQARSGRSTTTACGRVHQTTAERHARPRRIHAPREEVHAIGVSGQKPNVSSTRVRVSSASAREATPRMTSTARGQPCDVRIDPHHPRPSCAWHSRAGRGHLA